MEPENVREHFNDLAKTERENHAHAHPEYKFSPSKTPAASKKKRNDFSDEDEEENEPESGDPDWEWRPKNDRSTRTRSKRQGRGAGYPANNSNLNGMFEPSALGFDQGGIGDYAWSNAPRSMPVPYGMDQYAQLNPYEQSYHAQSEVTFPSPPYAALSDYPGGMPNGIPQQSHDGMFQGDPQFDDGTGHQVDPSLLSFPGAFAQSATGEVHSKIESEAMGGLWEDHGYAFGGEGMDHWGSPSQM